MRPSVAGLSVQMEETAFLMRPTIARRCVCYERRRLVAALPELSRYLTRHHFFILREPSHRSKGFPVLGRYLYKGTPMELTVGKKIVFVSSASVLLSTIVALMEIGRAHV